MDPVWTLFSRRTYSQIAYWLSALGYNLRDPSASNRLYLGYFILFWLGWAAAVFALFGGLFAQVIRSLQWTEPFAQTAALAVGFLSSYALLALWRAARRSPFIFREEDRFLLCMTPVDRRQVGLAWFAMGWLGEVLPFAAGAVIAAFGLVELEISGRVSVLQFGLYLAAALRALTIVLPLQAALLAAVWGLGARRLHGQSDWPALIFASPALAVLLGASAWQFGALRGLLLPLGWPLQIAFEHQPAALTWSGACLLSLVECVGGLALLASQSKRMHLGRAGQETARLALIQAASALGNSELAGVESQRQRLGPLHAPSTLPAGSGAAAVLWKDTVQTWRAPRWDVLFRWVLIFSAALGMFWAGKSPGNLPLQLILAGLWAILTGAQSTRRLRSDLARWWLLRSLPIRPAALLRSELLLSWAASTLLCWLALALARLDGAQTIAGFFLAPCLSAGAAYAAAFDILRRSQARTLMAPSLAEENVPGLNIGGVLAGLLAVLIPFSLLAAASADPRQAYLLSLALPVGLASAYAGERLALQELRQIK